MRAIVIATAIGLAAPSYAQVRVITGDVEHIYGPGGEILDDPQLRAKNQRAQKPAQSSRGALDPSSNKGCPSSRVVHVERLIVGHDTSPRRAGGTTITMNRPRARGAASELGRRTEDLAKGSGEKSLPPFAPRPTLRRTCCPADIRVRQSLTDQDLPQVASIDE